MGTCGKTSRDNNNYAGQNVKFPMSGWLAAHGHVSDGKIPGRTLELLWNY